MNDATIIELFMLKCSVIELDLKRNQDQFTGSAPKNLHDYLGQDFEKYLLQFESESRLNAANMSVYYQVFHMLENDIRRLIADTMISAFGENWWDSKSPQKVKEDAKFNLDREIQSGVSLRSESMLDYTTFGQLGDIIRENYDVFAGIFSDQKAVNRVLYALNMLRGTIAHCGVLAEDEVDRLKLAIKDWFRVLDGPR